jgi:hypothetical protein
VAQAQNWSGEAPATKCDAEWMESGARQHRANFDLWHIEDEARAPGASDRELAECQAPRRYHQPAPQRPDRGAGPHAAGWLGSRDLPNPDAPLHSESPGLIIDRLSILALKIYHTREEAERADAPEGHAERNRERLGILEEQRADLAECLDACGARR